MFDRLRKAIKKMGLFDMSLVKLSAAAAALMVAKLYPPLLSLEWHHYLIIALLLAIKPMMLLCDCNKK